MKLNEIISFRKDLYFNGAVQSEWFYNPTLAKSVAENFVFSSASYFGVGNIGSNKRIDTITLLNNISSKIGDERANPLTLAIADYGTGKSHLSVTMAQLFSGPQYMPETYNNIIDNIAKLDKEKAAIIKENCSRKNLVLVINGMRDFNLHSEILKAAQKSLSLYGVSDEKLRKINKSIETAELFFDRNCQTSITLFETYALEVGWNEKGNALINKIKDNLLIDDNAFNIINKVYEYVNGHQIRWDEGISAGSVLDGLINNYCGFSGEFDSVILLFDEFGRYLEYASGTDSVRSGESALQQIFECTQNSEGQLQVINFIQSDIKTYLQRVDNTTNISRYIGRYDISDKYYISSNLETVFANLIQRKDSNVFENQIVTKLNSRESEWKTMFTKLGSWISTTGVWAQYPMFRKVIVEGIYPMHPLSTFMLTQLSDYLQNRSSLTLVSEYIDSFGNEDLENGLPIVLPNELMLGDLFTEMLATEEDGKQSSQYCILYSNILKKYQDKFNPNTLNVLRSNLVLRILKFRMADYNDILYALSICSGLSVNEVQNELNILDNEYGVLAYDDRAVCYDFVEESSGAYDYKVFKRRLLSTIEYDSSLLRDSNDIKELADVVNLEEPNFSMKHYISTKEFTFQQYLMPIENFDETIAKYYISEFENAVDPCTPKGKLIWLYVCKDTVPEMIDNVCKLSSLFENIPTKIEILNDKDNRLKDYLIEYKFLHSISQKDQDKYYKHYKLDVEQNRANISAEFLALKKTRLGVTPSGPIAVKGRLSNEINSEFERIYTSPVPFNFDGFITSKNNVSTKAGSTYCTIIRTLLSQEINQTVIHSNQAEVKNRFVGLLDVKAKGSYKCLTDDSIITEPQEPVVNQIYNQLYNALSDDKSFAGLNLLKVFSKPPFGMNEYSIILMLSVFIANFRDGIRVSYKNNTYSSSSWENLLIDSGKKNNEKIIIDVFKESSFKLVDIQETEKKMENLFKAIENNKDVDKVKGYRKMLDDLLLENDLPDRFVAKYKFAEKILNDGEIAKTEWKSRLKGLRDKNEEMSPRNIYPGLSALSDIQMTNFDELFSKYNYYFNPMNKNELAELEADIKDFIFDNFEEYLTTVECTSIEKVQVFKNHNKKVVDLLKVTGLFELADLLQEKIDSEATHIDLIRSREYLDKDVTAFLKSLKFNNNTTFNEIDGKIKEYQELANRYKECSATLGQKREKIKSNMSKAYKIIVEQRDMMNNDIISIFDDALQIKDISDGKQICNRIDVIISRGLKKIDEQNLNELKVDVEKLIEDITKLNDLLNSRQQFDNYASILIETYDQLESDVLSSEMIEGIINQKKALIDEKDVNWRKKYFISFNDDVNLAYRWKTETKVLPLYLSDNTLNEYRKYQKNAEKVISTDRINTVKKYYSELTDEEKKEFINFITNN